LLRAAGCAIRRAGSGGARGLVAAAILLAAGCSVPHWPVQGPVTSAYGLRFRGLSPDLHRGVDVYVPDGTPVHAMASGTVEHAGSMSGYGLVVIMRHGANTISIYAHLSRIDVTRGQRIDGRPVIALSGHSGNATGPHLHFEIQRWGRTEDPIGLLGRLPGGGR
jgi:murein DD-endopeptidase MepM/ murein hydrolase activator NlpD